jgi:hypothetical protein
VCRPKLYLQGDLLEMWGEETVIQIVVEISILMLLLIGALVGIIYRTLVTRINNVHLRIDKMEESKVDKEQCKLREKHEDEAFNKINGTLEKLDSTFATKSTDVVGTMEDILELLEKRTKRRRR